MTFMRQAFEKGFITKLVIIVVLLVAAWQLYAFLQRRSDARQLVEFYRQAMGPVNDRNNIFYPEAQLHYQDSLLNLSGNSPKQTISAEYFKAGALLKLGQEQAAIDLLTDVVEKLKIYRGQAPGEDPRKLLALAYLR